MRSPPRAALLLFCSSFAAFFWAVKRRQFALAMTGGFDSAQYDQALWFTLRGAFMRTSLHGDPISILALHATFFHALLAPLYALFPRPETLSQAQTLLFAASAVPLCLAAEKRLGRRPGLLLTAACLLHPAVTDCLLNGYYGTRIFPVPFLIAALWALDEGRDGWFTLAALAAAACDEATALVVAGIGVFAALALGRRRLGWSLAGAAGIYFIAAVAVIQPYFGNFNVLGPLELPIKSPTTLGSAAVYAASHPLRLCLNALQARKAWYAFKLFAPLLFLPLRAAAWLLPAAPVAGLTLFLTPRWLLADFTPAWTALCLPFLFFAAIEGAARLAARPRARAGLCAAAAAASLAAHALGERSTLTCVLFPEPGALRNAEDLRAVLALIPKDAAVAATDTALPYLEGRERLYALLPAGLARGPAFVLLEDGAVPGQTPGPDPAAAHARLTASVRADSRYRLRAARGAFTLLQAAR